MANSDSFQVLRSDYPTGHAFQLQSLTGATTAEQLFLMGGAQTALVGVPSQTAIYGSFAPVDPNANGALTIDELGTVGGFRNLRGKPYFNSGTFDGRGFRVRAVGRYNQQAASTNAQTVTFKLTQGTAVSSSKVISSITSGTNLASGPGNFVVEATILWDSALQVLTGEFWGNCSNGTSNVYTSRGGLSNLVSVTAYTGLQFVASVVFATSSANSTANLVEFSMEAV